MISLFSVVEVNNILIMKLYDEKITLLQCFPLVQQQQSFDFLSHLNHCTQVHLFDPHQEVHDIVPKLVKKSVQNFDPITFNL